MPMFSEPRRVELYLALADCCLFLISGRSEEMGRKIDMGLDGKILRPQTSPRSKHRNSVCWYFHFASAPYPFQVPHSHHHSPSSARGFLTWKTIPLFPSTITLKLLAVTSSPTLQTVFPSSPTPPSTPDSSSSIPKAVLPFSPTSSPPSTPDSQPPIGKVTASDFFSHPQSRFAILSHTFINPIFSTIGRNRLPVVRPSLHASRSI
ncbi:hypothetical protein N656DRAFT_76456 [Canariomyces notabilis]|uniref:Uncharacterized protein n=1 Tax=Canariomyces notabilis TaxID=2074819 RepID=A0AAN6TE77_9PEZI|nr:hypothetical protein N656DRAFT_76456 [Canariomyces arenarius]